jgi:hypothetical protein
MQPEKKLYRGIYTDIAPSEIYRKMKNVVAQSPARRLSRVELSKSIRDQRNVTVSPPTIDHGAAHGRRLRRPGASKKREERGRSDNVLCVPEAQGER